MKLIREQLYEKFTEGGDPIADMGIGKKNQILKDLQEIDLDETDVEFHDDFTFFLKNRHEKHQIGEFISVQLKYFPDGKKELLEGLERSDEDVIKLINNAVSASVSVKDITYIVNYALTGLTWGETRYSEAAHDLGKAKIYIAKLSRTKKKVKEEEENNTYVFIGFMDKVPVTIKGKKYYEDRLNTETIVKINKYNLGQLQSIGMMKLRARVQYGSDAEVYRITLPKDLMDEDRYEKIPEEYYEIFVKYKVRL